VRKRTVDKIFVFIIVLAVTIGTGIFVSASLGLLAREGVTQAAVIVNHFIGLAAGLIALIVASHVPYATWKQYSFYIYIGAILVTLLVFVPGVGFEHGGAKRWIDIGPQTVQPAELLKVAFVIYFAALLSSLRRKLGSFTNGVLPVILVILVPLGILSAQPDTGTSLVLIATAGAMYIAAGGPWKYVAGLAAGVLAGAALLIVRHAYIRERIMTFFDPSHEVLGSSYQLQQSLIAIGSGGVFGRGFGQSVQKFDYLPEPIGDSIFAVAGEEFGFIGAVIIVCIFFAFLWRSLSIARHAPNRFSGLMVLGLAILITIQSYINIGAMIGVVPLTGIPLVFVSHGGTSLVFALLSVGIILHVSKFRRI
jgi:cell division protein FtsW